MKRLERKHLKEDELARRLRIAREFVEPRQHTLKNVGIAVVVVLLGVVAVGFWRERTDSRGEKELAEAMVAVNAEVVPVAPRSEACRVRDARCHGNFFDREAKLTARYPAENRSDAYPSSPSASRLVSHGRRAPALDAPER